MLAAFDIYTGLGDFLYESEINNLAEEVLPHPPAESLSVVLVLGVIATGRHVLENQTTFLPVDLGASRQVFAEACARINPFLLGHNSLLKLQVSFFLSCQILSCVLLTEPPCACLLLKALITLVS
jgi:hypothetical protein